MGSVCLSHSCTLLFGRNEMPFSTDTRVVLSNIVWDWGLSPAGRGVWEVGSKQPNQYSENEPADRTPPNAKLLWPQVV